MYGYVLSDPINSIDPEGKGPATAALCSLVAAAFGFYGDYQAYQNVSAELDALQEVIDQGEKQCNSSDEVNPKKRDLIDSLKQRKIDLAGKLASEFGKANSTSIFSAVGCGFIGAITPY